MVLLRLIPLLAVSALAADSVPDAAPPVTLPRGRKRQLESEPELPIESVPEAAEAQSLALPSLHMPNTPIESFSRRVTRRLSLGLGTVVASAAASVDEQPEPRAEAAPAYKALNPCKMEQAGPTCYASAKAYFFENLFRAIEPDFEETHGIQLADCRHNNSHRFPLPECSLHAVIANALIRLNQVQKLFEKYVTDRYGELLAQLTTEREECERRDKELLDARIKALEEFLRFVQDPTYRRDTSRNLDQEEEELDAKRKSVNERRDNTWEEKWRFMDASSPTKHPDAAYWSDEGRNFDQDFAAFIDGLPVGEDLPAISKGAVDLNPIYWFVRAQEESATFWDKWRAQFFQNGRENQVKVLEAILAVVSQNLEATADGASWKTQPTKVTLAELSDIAARSLAKGTRLPARVHGAFHKPHQALGLVMGFSSKHVRFVKALRTFRGFRSFLGAIGMWLIRRRLSAKPDEEAYSAAVTGEGHDIFVDKIDATTGMAHGVDSNHPKSEWETPVQFVALFCLALSGDVSGVVFEDPQIVGRSYTFDADGDPFFGPNNLVQISRDGNRLAYERRIAIAALPSAVTRKVNALTKNLSEGSKNPNVGPTDSADSEEIASTWTKVWQTVKTPLQVIATSDPRLFVNQRAVRGMVRAVWPVLRKAEEPAREEATVFLRKFLGKAVRANKFLKDFSVDKELEPRGQSG